MRRVPTAVTPEAQGFPSPCPLKSTSSTAAFISLFLTAVVGFSGAETSSGQHASGHEPRKAGPAVDR